MPVRWCLIPELQMKKVLKVLAFTFGYVLAYLIVLFIALYVADFFETNFGFSYIDLGAFVFGNILMIGLLIYVRRRTRDKWIRAEAEKWLVERASRAGSNGHLRRRKLQRGMLWIPSAVVLTVFLFLPEAIGIGSHLFCGRFVRVGQYRLKTPLKWIVAGHDNSSAWVIGAKGIGRVGFRTYWLKNAPVSEMVVSVSPYSSAPSEWYLAHAKVLSKQSLQLVHEKLICWDIVSYADTRPNAMDPRAAEILCSSERNDFQANFIGQRSDSPTFYEILRSAAQNE
jgi:hypothetical protein